MESVFFYNFAAMKTHQCILVCLLAVMLCACDTTTREARRMVKRAELLADTLPDSTVRLIDSVLRMPASLSERERMDMALLQAEALFGDHGQEISPVMDDDFFDEHANHSTSPELERAAAYYAGKKQNAKAAHAALYSGFVQQHYNEKESAMKSFKDAELYGEMSKDSLIVARTHCLMGKMMYEDYADSVAISLFKSADRKLGSRFAERAMVQSMMSVCFIVHGDFENAENSLNRSMVFAEQSCTDKVLHKVLNNYAVLYRLQGKYNQAIECLRQIGKEPKLTESEEAILYLNFGNSFASSGEIDSATIYYQHLEDILHNINVKDESRISAYGALSQFAKSLGNDSLALQYREKHEKLMYEVMQRRQEQSFYRIQKQYDYENLQNALNKKIILRHRIILIISLLLLVATIIILVLQLRQKQMKEAEAEMKRQIDNLKNDLQESIKTSYLEQELSSRLRLTVAAYRAQKKAYDPNKEWSSVVFKLMNGKVKLFDAVLEEMEKVYPDIYTVLRQKYPELNETETKVCLLSSSDLSNTEIAEILGMSKYTIDKNRSKLRDKLNLKPEKMKEQLHKAISH